MADGTAVAILLAGGSGTRLGGGGPKALVEVGDRSLLRWAVETVEGCDAVNGFVCVGPMRAVGAVERVAESPRLVAVVEGGPRRQDSVRAGLAALPPGCDRVLCHDVARPFARPGLFASVLEALHEADGAVPVVGVVDTLKRVSGDRVVETLSRSDVVAAQTPQAFRRAALEDAHRRAEADGVEATDDAMLLERAGYVVAAVPGDPETFKVTVPADLRRAEEVLSTRG